MLFQLAESDYSKLQSLKTIPPIQLNIDSFIEQTSKAKVWLDDPDHPKTAYVWDTGYRHYLIGDTTNHEFNTSLIHFLNDKLIPEIAIKKKYYYFYVTDKWAPIISDLNLSPVIRERLFFQHRTANFLPKDISKVNDLVLEPVTTDLLEKSNIKHIPDIKEIEECWPSIDKFFEIGFGFCLYNEETVAGWCLGEYFSSEKCGVGIETYPEYQNKGYATLLASALIRHGQKRGLNIYWDSWKDNVPSIRVAEKMGFERIYEYKVYFGSFDELLNIIIPGDIAYRQGKYEEAIEIYLQAVEMRPEENWLYWNIAVKYQKQGLTKQVFEYLYKAIDYGMTSFQQFENSPHFKDLHSLPEWKELISKLKRTK
jgi:RimJ/RimL family protein N-acetyltransferase